MTPDLAIIIPHYNDTERLARCLEALGRQDLTGVEVVVADNASDQDLGPVLARFDWARLVVAPEAGAGLARNAGVAASTAPWLAFIDADCVAGEAWVSRAKQIAAGDRSRITGGRVDVFDETPPPRSGAEAFETVFAFQMRRYLEEEAFLGAGNLVVSRPAFEQAGPFLATVSEDKEWSQRAASRGLVLAFDDALAVGHPSRRDWAALRRKWHRINAETFALRVARGAGRGGWGMRALMMPVSVLAHAPRVLRHPALGPGEKLRGLATLARIRLARMIWMLSQALRGDG